jgi:hypothetical protein
VSTAQLAQETGLSERAVISHIKAVEAQWLGIRRHGFGDQRWARNEYLPRLPGDPSLDVKGTERPSVPPAEIAGEGTECGSAPFDQKGTERHDAKALNVVHPDNGFDFSITPLNPPINLEHWFESEFWPAYPLKVAKARALRAMRRLKPDATLRAVIMARLRDWLDERRALERTRGAFVPQLPHPATWLNDRRWTDEAANVPRETKRDDRGCWSCGKPAVAVTSGKAHCRKHDPIFHSEGMTP